MVSYLFTFWHICLHCHFFVYFIIWLFTSSAVWFHSQLFVYIVSYLFIFSAICISDQIVSCLRIMSVDVCLHYQKLLAVRRLEYFGLKYGKLPHCATEELGDKDKMLHFESDNNNWKAQLSCSSAWKTFASFSLYFCLLNYHASTLFQLLHLTSSCKSF